MAEKIENRVRLARIARGLTQVELAHHIKISRQALSAIESDVYQPSVTVALDLANELGHSVEALFGAPTDHASHIYASWRPSAAKRAKISGCRVALGRVGGKMVAVAQPAAQLALMPACGIVENATSRTAEVTSFRSQNEIDANLLIAGCDPAVAILVDWLLRRGSSINAVALSCSSDTALDALLTGQVHIAGVHLHDPDGGDYNIKPVKRRLRGRPAVLVNFAKWELGLATATGNPLEIAGFEDFSRKEVRLINREKGSGARAVMDEALRRAEIKTNEIKGYGREVNGHLEVADAIAKNEANVGVTIRLAAQAYRLHFIPFREERYDLVVLRRDIDSQPVKALFEALSSPRFAKEVSQLCGYDTSQMGHTIARLNG